MDPVNSGQMLSKACVFIYIFLWTYKYVRQMLIDRTFFTLNSTFNVMHFFKRYLHAFSTDHVDIFPEDTHLQQTEQVNSALSSSYSGIVVCSEYLK